MLGITLPNPSLQTDDIDIAQFEDVSVAVADQTGSVLDTLKEADGTFRAVPRRLTEAVSQATLQKTDCVLNS